MTIVKALLCEARLLHSTAICGMEWECPLPPHVQPRASENKFPVVPIMESQTKFLPSNRNKNPGSVLYLRQIRSHMTEDFIK